MNETKVSVLLTAEDKVTEVLNKVQGSLGGFKKSMKDLEPQFKVLAVAGGVAFGAISGVAVTSLNAFVEADKQMSLANKILDNSLKELNGSGLAQLQKSLGGNKDALGGLKKVMGEVGKQAIQLNFDDEQASVAFAKFFQVTKNVETAQRDLKLAMDLSAYSGKDLESSQQAIIKAYAGGARILKDFGIELEDGASKQAVFNAIQEKAGGLAQEQADTMAGRIGRLQKEFGNLQEGIGGALAPALQKVLVAIEPVITRFTEWAEKNPDLLAKIIIVGGAIAGLALVVGTLGLALPAIITGVSMLTTGLGVLAGAFAFLVSPIGLIVLAIAGLIAIGVLLYQNWDVVKMKSKEVWDAISLWVYNSTQKIISVITNMWTYVQNMFVAFGGAVTNTWNSLWAGLGNIVSGAWEGIKGIVTNSINYIMDKVNAVINAINSVASAGAGLMGFNAPQIGTLPRFAEGGIVTRPTTALIGEAGAEAVIPLSRLSDYFGGGMQPITVNINGGNYLSQDAGLMLGNQIIDVLKRNMRI